MLTFAKSKSSICKQMDIVNRIKQFMNAGGISSTQFADACGIPRPTLSQILSGRNKKISDEVISKIHDAYPSLSVLWLLFGEGSMTMGGNTPLSEAQNGAKKQFSASEMSDIEGHIFGDMPSQSSLFPESDNVTMVFDDEPGDNEAADSRALESSTLETSVEGSTPVVQIPADGSKTIVNIMVLYSDNSFQSFVPR